MSLSVAQLACRPDDWRPFTDIIFYILIYNCNDGDGLAVGFQRIKDFIIVMSMRMFAVQFVVPVFDGNTALEWGINC